MTVKGSSEDACHGEESHEAAMASGKEKDSQSLRAFRLH